jgi:putative ABC transport system permease protein
MKTDYYVLAWKNVKRRGVRSWLTLLGIIIGITAVVSLISLGDGLKTAVNSQFGIGATELISVQAGGITAFGPPGSGVVTPLTLDDVDAIERLSTVETAIGRNIETVKVEYNNILNIGFAASIPEGIKGNKIYEYLEIDTVEGRLIFDGDTNKIVLGNDFLYGEKNGFNKPIHTGDSITLQDREFRVVGIMQKKGSFILDQAILVMETPLRELMNSGESVDLIVVKIKDKDLMDNAEIEIEKLLRERRDVKEGEEDFEVSTPQATLESVNQVLAGIQIFIVLIASIAIFVGAVGIVNTMTTSVLERVKEIGIMKAIGARNSDIFFQFFIEAGLLGFIGGIVGVCLGLGIGFVGIQGINSFIGATTSMKLNLPLIFGTLIGSFLIGSISGIAPALKAANLNPVEALRK